MAAMILKKTDLVGFVQSLADRFQVWGPVQTDGRGDFQAASPDRFNFNFQNSYLSPKSLFFPQTERMFVYSTDKSRPDAFIMKDVDSKIFPRLVFGLRPCDAKAFFILDRIFTNDQFSDPYWVQKREATVLIGLGCNQPCPTCFCTNVNCGPFHQEGLDALAFDLGDCFLIKPLTDKGRQALTPVAGLTPAGAGDEDKAGALQKSAEETIVNKVSTDRILARTVLELYDAAHWARVQEGCLNCGTCTFVCPTCHCFDIQDEVTGTAGDRVRNWDTCMSWLFTYHGSGHNPRPSKKERVRQRFMHKFKYIPMKRGGEIGCVGCGRCINLCPVNIDVRDVVRDMNV